MVTKALATILVATLVTLKLQPWVDCSWQAARVLKSVRNKFTRKLKGMIQ